MSDAPRATEEKVGMDFKQVITWLIAFACGGLGGSVLGIWYANRSTVIQYSVNKTVLGTDQTTVVPNFRVQVGEATLQSLYIHVVKIQHSSGPELENARIGVELKPGVKLVGNTVPEKPGEAFDFKCEAFVSRPTSVGTTCLIRRLNSNVGAYSLSFATDGDVSITLSMDAKNTELRRADLPSGKEPQLFTWGMIAFVMGLTLVKILADLTAPGVARALANIWKK